jgi:hypothetical protein
VSRETDEASARLSTLIQLLNSLDAGAEDLARDNSLLSFLRHAKPKSGPTSLENEHVWQPVFLLWSHTGHRVGYTENGPLMRIISVMHWASDIPAPSDGSVRSAIVAFNKGGDETASAK